MVVGGLAKIGVSWFPSEDFNILDLESLNWIQGNFCDLFFMSVHFSIFTGQPLPYGLRFHQMVKTEDNKFVFMGGTGKQKTDLKYEIFELSCGTNDPKDCQWKDTTQRIIQARHKFLAFPVSMRCPCV